MVGILNVVLRMNWGFDMSVQDIRDAYDARRIERFKADREYNEKLFDIEGMQVLMQGERYGKISEEFFDQRSRQMESTSELKHPEEPKPLPERGMREVERQQLIKDIADETLERINKHDSDILERRIIKEKMPITHHNWSYYHSSRNTNPTMKEYADSQDRANFLPDELELD